MRGVEGGYWNENVFARPKGLREKAETAFSCRDLDLSKGRKILTSSWEEDVGAQMYPCGAE